MGRHAELGADGKVLAEQLPAASSGTVTSVALTMPTEYSVTGSPITTSGTLAVSKQNQTANLIYAGPASGGAAAPLFRALVFGDLPVSPTVKVTHSANQSIAHDTPTALFFDTEYWDTDNMHYTSAANLTGTVSKTAASNELVGSSTSFSTELSVGQMISVPGGAVEKKIVTVITDNTHLNVSGNFANTSSGQTATRINSVLVARTAGKYLILGAGQWANNATGQRQLQLKGEGGAIHALDQHLTANRIVLQICTKLDLAQWAWLELVAYQTSGVSLDMLNSLLFFAMVRIG